MSSLIVSSQANHQVLQYDLATGLYSGTPLIPSGGLLVQPTGIKYNSGQIYVASAGTNQILTYNPDGSGGAVFISGNGLNFPRGIVFDTAGNLYVANLGSDSVLYFNAAGTPRHLCPRVGPAHSLWSSNWRRRIAIRGEF